MIGKSRLRVLKLLSACRQLVLGLTLLAAVPAAQAAEKIILDTDTAVFNDDGAALVMLLRQPEEIDLLGVTVVAGNHRALQGAEHLLHLMEVMGQHVPLYIGAQRPLVNSARRAALQEEQWGAISFKGAFAEPARLEPPIGGRYAEQRPEKKDAVSFLIETIDANPGQITLLAIGPMTNLAMALIQRPDLAGKVKRLVFMGGNARVPGNVTPYAEFNFWFDPEAAKIVLDSEIPEKIMFGLDVTNKAVIRKEHFDLIAAADTPLTRIFAQDMGHGWPGFYTNPAVTGFIWDCLAVAWLLDPSLFSPPSALALDVVTDFSAAYGGTFVVRQAEGHSVGSPVQVIEDLDFPRFFELYKDLLTRP